LYTIAGRIRAGHLCASAALREIIPEVRWRQTLSEIGSRKAAKLAKKNPMQPRESVKRMRRPQMWLACLIGNSPPQPKGNATYGFFPFGNPFFPSFRVPA
jgi:hypothetical protein